MVRFYFELMHLIPLQWIRQRNIFVGHLLFLMFEMFNLLPMSYCFCRKEFTLFSMWYCFCSVVFTLFFLQWGVYLIFNVVLFLWWRIYTLFSMSYCFCSEVSLWDTGSISPASLSLSSGNIKTQHSFPNYNSGNWLFLTLVYEVHYFEFSDCKGSSNRGDEHIETFGSVEMHLFILSQDFCS